ncbi:MAG: hypothetical protein CMJ35_03220 [Phycisphaerae bacterium]|nr:hypothetical protein [Phycisphaerae bacterium]MBM90610.1 hypothetical protein [Phycisphaerae bacterium]HCT45726.1 hypothetical protein [Phycisphaerales bacterium]|tara:strand:- start:821 stop:1450 length:630 start_codon:yes stop_codon:yes gene_type:complete
MQNILKYGVAIGVLASIAHADLYRVTMTGEVSTVNDSRTSSDDVFDGTAWDVDVFAPSVGDTWAYEVIYDTDILASFMDDQTAIYNAHFASSISINGNTLSGFNSVTNFFGGTVEIFGGMLIGGGHFDVYAFFSRQDGLDELINGGMLPDSTSFFDGLDVSYFSITDEDNFEVGMSAGTPFGVTVEQIPAPGAIIVLGLGGLMSTRRKR